MSKYALEVVDLNKTFAHKKVLHDINLKIKPEESIVIMGESGSGKSTLLKCILGILLPDPNSKILLNGKDITNVLISSRYKLDLNFGVLFQESALFDEMKIWENVIIGLSKKSNDIRSKRAKDIAIEKLEMVGIEPDAAFYYPKQLSGGMQKRVALARAISMNPEFLFLDEPTSGLDLINASNIANLISDIIEKIGATVITVTHDILYANKIADRVVFVEQGAIKGECASHDILNNDSILKNFIDAMKPMQNIKL